MRLSRFVLTYEHVRPGEHVLYDVIEDRYIGVDDVVLTHLRSAGAPLPSASLTPEVEDILRDQGFLAAPGADDARLRRFLDAAAEGIPETMNVTVMPTLVCNLACTYCFQKDHPSFNHMKDAVGTSTIEWILRKVDAAASRVLNVHYFGGEPLTRKDYLLHSAQVLSSSMRARGGHFQWLITTNGVALDVDFVNKMLAFGPGGIKVTLDGDKQTHDAARVYRSGKGSFDEIFERLGKVARECPDVKLRVGGNFRPDQLESYERLLDRFEAEGLGPLINQFRFKPVVDTGASSTGTCATACGAQQEVDMQLQLQRSVERRGLGQTRAAGATPTNPCELHWKHSYVVDPDGYVYKCPAVAGRPEMAVAHVGNPVKGERPAPLLELRPWEKCGDCPYLPVCVGGCLGGKYLQTGRRDEVFCRRAQFDVAFRQEVLERYLTEFPDEAPGEASSPPSPGGDNNEDPREPDEVRA